MGPNELASLVVLLAMLRARLASARSERQFLHTLDFLGNESLTRKRGCNVKMG